MKQKSKILKKLKNTIVVSCQPIEGGPQDNVKTIVSMALAAEIGGCGGLRIEGAKNIYAVRKVTKLPIIGIIKNILVDYSVRITPLIKDVEKIAKNGADIIAYDATQRNRPYPTKEIVNKIKGSKCIAMADCSNLKDAVIAIKEGADIISSTLSGYVGRKFKDTDKPDLHLIKKYKKLNCFIMAEGRFNTPELAKKAIEYGADAVTVGSAITRIENITNWYATVVKK
jgi:N-acylglucosamine-6-phosphate 2-epimerase